MRKDSRGRTRRRPLSWRRYKSFPNVQQHSTLSTCSTPVDILLRIVHQASVRNDLDSCLVAGPSKRRRASIQPTSVDCGEVRVCTQVRSRGGTMDYGSQMEHSDRQYLHGVGGVDSPLHDMADHQFDSSSSSGSDNHSSPAESSYTATSQHDWALDGLSLDLALPWSPGAPPTLAALDPGFITPSSKPPQQHESVQQQHHTTDSSSKETLALTHDFWNAAPDDASSTDHHLHTEAVTRPSHGSLGEINGSASRNGIIQAQHSGATESMQMDFDDVVHGDVCG